MSSSLAFFRALGPQQLALVANVYTSVVMMLTFWYGNTLSIRLNKEITKTV